MFPSRLTIEYKDGVEEFIKLLLSMPTDGEILSPRFKLTASARSFDVALEGRSTGTGGSYGFNTSKRIDQRSCESLF